MFLTVLMTLPPEGQDRFFLLWETVRENLVKYVRMKLNGVPTYKDCEDIVEDAFVRVMEQYERYHDRPDEEIKAILIRTCDNLCSNEKTRSRRIVTVSLSAEEDGGVINEASLSGEEVMTPAHPTGYSSDEDSGRTKLSGYRERVEDHGNRRAAAVQTGAGGRHQKVEGGRV